MKNNISYEINKLRKMLKEVGYMPMDLEDEYGQILLAFFNGYTISVNAQGPEYASKKGLLKLVIIEKCEWFFELIDPEKDRRGFWKIAHNTPPEYNVMNDLTAEEAFEFIQAIDALWRNDEE